MDTSCPTCGRMGRVTYTTDAGYLSTRTCDTCKGEGVISVSRDECAGCEDNANARHTCGRLDCCDGTGWTGNPSERCGDHYEPHDLGEFGFIAVH